MFNASAIPRSICGLTVFLLLTATSWTALAFVPSKTTMRTHCNTDRITHYRVNIAIKGADNDDTNDSTVTPSSTQDPRPPLVEQVKSYLGNWKESYIPDISVIRQNSNQIIQNVWSGEVGNRGEIYVFGQVALLLCILLGDVPVVGGILQFVMGPGLLLSGIAIIVAGVVEMGPALSPWPVPPSIQNELIVTGVFSFVRHPLYSGLLAIGVGLAVLTQSPLRLIFTAALFLLLDAKANFEEEQLRDVYPEYRAYSARVTGKFLPLQYLNTTKNEL